MKKGVATLAQRAEFDEIIDVRSPAEFAEDRLPGAVNYPVLDDAQRAEIGTIYKQVSPFEARRLGGAMVAENLARHLFAHFQDKPRNWRPLVYCWRGGMRSGAFVHWLRLIGWEACQLEGGYKRWRQHVVEALPQQVARLNFRVVCGPTGSAKTRLLHALAKQGAQVLDLEGLAGHKGSVLGQIPGIEQPSQRSFETLLFETLSALSAQRSVYVEAESRKIGRLHLPEALIERMRTSPCLSIEAGLEARIEFLLRDYAYFSADPADLAERLGFLRGLHSNESLQRWRELALGGQLAALYRELLEQHYDPLYRRSLGKNYPQREQGPSFATADLSEAGLDALAARILAQQAG